MNDRAVTRIAALRSIAILLLTAVAAPIQAAGVVESGLADRIDQVMSRQYPAQEPGAAVLAARDGKVVFRGAYGLANMELRIPVTPEMVFGLASVTKLFTAVGAMMLVEDGKLRLEDEVIDYLPQLSNTKGATIAHLLSHTSGMTGPATMVPGYREQNFHREITSEALIAGYAEFPLAFAPGERFAYSNEGVATLARIIEIVSQQRWEEFLRQRIFDPAGMKSTYYGGHNRIIPMAVSGYSSEAGEWKRAQPTSFTHGFGMGALLSNVDDLYSWYQALMSGRLLKPETLQAMLTPFPLNGGGKSRHGFGFVVADLHGHRIAAHGGSHPGWSTFVILVPGDGIFVTVLTNRSAGEHKAMDDAMAIVRLMLDDAAS